MGLKTLEQPRRIEFDLRMPDLNEFQKLAVGRAANELPEAFNPTSLNHRGSALVDVNGSVLGTGGNTRTPHGGKHCAEQEAINRAKISLARKQCRESQLAALAVMSKRYSLDSSTRPQPEAPAAPCGECLSIIQRQAPFFGNLAELSVVMGASNKFLRASFGDLFPVPTVAALSATINRSLPPPEGSTITTRDSCCSALGDRYTSVLPQAVFNQLFMKVHDELKYSQIDQAPALKIAYGTLTKRTIESPDNIETVPLITDSCSPGTEGIRHLVASSKPSRCAEDQIKCLLIAVNGPPHFQLGSAGDFQFFAGEERQRIFDLADMTQYDIPVFISWRAQYVIAAPISVLAPLYEAHSDSRSAQSKLAFYTTRLGSPVRNSPQ